MLDHITFTVSDVGRAQAFYDRALAPLGIAAMVSVYRRSRAAARPSRAMARPVAPSSGSAAASR